MIRPFLLMLLLAALTGPAAASDVRIDNAWVRAVPPVSPVMAAYFSLTNETAEPLVLTGGRAAFAGRVMLHAMHRNKAGMGRMHSLRAVTMAPGATVLFRPGERHLMLMALKSVPAAGETVRICLSFQQHPDVCAPFPVRREAPDS